MTVFDDLALVPRPDPFISLAGEEWRAVGWERAATRRKLVLTTDAFMVEMVEQGRFVQWNKHLFLTRHLHADAYGKSPQIEEAARAALQYEIPSEQYNGLMWFEHSMDANGDIECWVAAADVVKRALVMRNSAGLYEAHLEIMGERDFFGLKHTVAVDHLESSRRFTNFHDAADECASLIERARTEYPLPDPENHTASVIPLPRR